MIQILLMLLMSLSLGSGCSGEAGIFNVDEACELYVDTYIDKLAIECRMMSEASAEQSIVAGFEAVGANSCDDFDALRDEDEFYDECIPGIAALTCDEVLRIIPPSCEMQLLQGD